MGPLSRDRRPDADESAALATIDEALATGRAGATEASERRLQEIALALQADAPRPAPEFERRLGRRVRAGFPRERGALGRGAAQLAARGRRLAGGLSLPRRAPLLAGAASLIVALAVGASLIRSGGEPTTPASEPGVAADGAASRNEAMAPDAAPGDVPVPGPPRAGEGGAVPGREARRVERSAELTLASPREELQEVAAGIGDAADRHDGVLLRSALSTGEEGPAGGSFELRVPVAELPAALSDLSGLATVRDLTQTTDDRTAELVGRRRAADASRAQLRRLRERLEDASSEARRARIRARVRATRAELRGARRAAERIETRTAFADLSVELVEGDSGTSGLGTALDDSLDLLEGVLAGALRALAVLLPLGVVAAATWVVFAGLRRRRRGSALV